MAATVTSITEKRKVQEVSSIQTPRRPKNKDVRPREYLTEQEVDRLISAAGKAGRNRTRDKLLILMMFSHGLRVSEACDLKRSQIDFDNSLLHVSRAKNGKPAVHPLRGQELRLLKQELARKPGSPWGFTAEGRLRGPMTVSGVQKIVKRAGKLSGLPFPVHPHMLRHACGYKLAAKGCDTRLIQDYLGHRQISHTVTYTELAPGRFGKLWSD